MLFASFIIFACLFAVTAGQCSNAQFTYNSVDQRCYYASRTSTTWGNARTICTNMGGRLAVVHDSYTDLAVYQAGAAVDPSLVFWIGLQVTGGMFQWVDGSFMDYNIWNSGYPLLTKGYDCVAARLRDREYWENLLCANSYPYICQANATFIPTTTTAGPFICPNNPYYGPSGSIASPNYPRDYPNNARCIYNIILSAGATVGLHVNDFYTEQCCDFLYIYNGPTTASPLIQRCSGTICFGSDFYSSSNTMTLQFITDQDTTFRGFNVSYSAIYLSTTSPRPTMPSDCITYNATGSGEFFSSNYPGNYTNNLRCSYVLNALSGRVPSINFRQFQTEAQYDVLYFFDSTAVSFGPNGQISYNGNPYLALSGTAPRGQTYYGRTQTTVLYFGTDESVTDIGFDGQWSSVTAPTATSG